MAALFTKVETERISELAALASSIWHEYFTEILSLEQIDYMVLKFQSEQAITEQVNCQGYCYYFIELDSLPIGFMGVKPEENTMFLSKLYIRKEFRGKGYASSALAFLSDLCKIEQKGSIWLTVNRYNEHTIEVYKKKGFEIIRSQVMDIGQGYVMDDYVMEKRL